MAQNEVRIKFIGEGDLLHQIQKLDKATKSLINAQTKLLASNKSNTNSLTKMLRSLRETGMSFKKLGVNVDTI